MSNRRHTQAFPYFIFLLINFFGFSISHADWISFTGAETAPNIAEIYINDDHVKVVLEVFVSDIEKLKEILPEEYLRNAGEQQIADINTRLRDFSENKFQIVTDTGQQLIARVDLIEPRLRIERLSPYAGMINPITRQAAPEPPQDKRVLYVELSYPFEQKPASLTIIPPIDENGGAILDIGFITYHKAVPVIDFRYLGSAATLFLDWDDPWYTRFENPNLKRHHKSAIMSYLYIEPYEVRHEVLVRVKDMQNWMDTGLSDQEFIEKDQLETVKNKISQFLLMKNPVKIDGESLKPILDRSNYVNVGLNGIQVLENPERLEVSTTIIGVIITYLTIGMPDKVVVDWELFSDQIKRVPAIAIDPAGPLMTFLEADRNQHEWTNFLKQYVIPTVQQVNLEQSLIRYQFSVLSAILLFLLIPLFWLLHKSKRAGLNTGKYYLLAVILLTAAVVLTPYTKVSVRKPNLIIAEIPDEQIESILSALLNNVYRAFDFRNEEDVYDKLEISVSGDMLRKIYLESRNSMLIEKAGGAQAKIENVEVLEATAKKAAAAKLAYDITAKWTAYGTVGHWGHVHSRKNLYDAIVTIQPDSGYWKIAAMEILQEQRIEPFTQKAQIDNKNQ